MPPHVGEGLGFVTTEEEEEKAVWPMGQGLEGWGRAARSPEKLEEARNGFSPRALPRKTDFTLLASGV